MNDNTLQQHLYSLSKEKKIELKNNLATAGIMHSNGKPTKLYFQALRDSSSGRLKKLYVAFAKAERNNLDSAFDKFVALS